MQSCDTDAVCSAITGVCDRRFLKVDMVIYLLYYRKTFKFLGQSQQLQCEDLTVLFCLSFVYFCLKDRLASPWTSCVCRSIDETRSKGFAPFHSNSNKKGCIHNINGLVIAL